MKPNTKTLGNAGEEAAAKYLKKNHYKILERNYFYGKHEIDIIAENHDFLIFVEVKTRTYCLNNYFRFGRPCMAIDYRKKNGIFDAARGYCLTSPIKKKIRMDVIEVYFNDQTPSRVLSIHHMPDAFRIKA